MSSNLGELQGAEHSRVAIGRAGQVLAKIKQHVYPTNLIYSRRRRGKLRVHIKTQEAAKNVIDLSKNAGVSFPLSRFSMLARAMFVTH